MFVQSSTIMAIVAVAAQVVVATQPPACVIAAVNTESDPSDFKTICNSDKATSYLSENCGNNLEAAQSYFEDICKTNGHEISLSDDKDSSSSSSRSSSPSATATGSDDETSATATASVTGSNTNGASGSTTAASATGSNVATTTGAASSVKLGMDVLGMGALLTFGAILAL